jgi:UDP-glucose 4-epimerase
MTIVRPCIVFGPNVDNYLVRLWTKQPFAVDVGTMERDIQFVHEEDVVEGITALLLGRHAGAYNVAGDGLMTNRECAELIDTPIRKMPLWLYRRLARVMWKLHQSEVPPGGIEFALHSWLLSNEKLKRTTGWSPKHTSRETFEITMRAHGKLPPAETAGTEFPAATLAA